jgi:competence protein ComEA
MTLPGIGQAKATLIVNYRSEHGLFTKKEDLMKISGIKEGVYNKIKDLITIT